MRFGSILCAVLSLLAVSLSAQPRQAWQRQIMENGKRFHADAYVVPTDQPDTAAIVVFFRMANDFLTFVRVTDPNVVAGNFVAPMIVGAELRDSLGVIRQRQRWDTLAYTNTYEQTTDPQAFRYGWMIFRVPAGRYAVSLEILQTRQKVGQELVLPDITFAPSGLTGLLARPLFVQPMVRQDREVLRPYVLSGDVGFSGNDARALLLVGDAQDTEYDYVVRQLPYAPNEIQWWDAEMIEGRSQSNRLRFPRLSPDASPQEALLEIRQMEERTLPIALLEIPIPISVLIPGNYEIALLPRGQWGVDTIRAPFRIVWEQMPLSLRNLDEAYQLMSYILTDEELDSLNEGSDQQRRRNLMGWWRNADETATTTYNERMQTFFRRADEATRLYSTIQEPRGSLSERGRVYILYGPPTTVSKRLPVDAEPRETWIYTNAVNKEITFGIDEQGMYRIRDVFDRSLLPPDNND